jgi:hypothetical protein
MQNNSSYSEYKPFIRHKRLKSAHKYKMMLSHHEVVPPNLKLSMPFESWSWWSIPVIPAVRRLRQKDCKFKASPDYIIRP